MMIPQNVRFVLLWLFYITAIILSLLEITLMVYLLVYPEYVYQTYIYTRSTVSILHCIICSLIVACGFIAIATMKQIRLSLQVILKEVSKEQAMKRLRFSMALLTSIWCLNQVGSIVILLYYFSSATTELYFQVFGMFTATTIFAYQLVRLLKAMKRLES